MKEINFATSLESLDDRYVLNEDWFVMPPVEEWHDPTGGLPVDPDVGDRYISDATAGGWTTDYIYEWDGTEWVEYEPEEGWMIWMLFELMFYVFFSGGWMEVGSDSFVDEDGDTMTGDLTFSSAGVVDPDYVKMNEVTLLGTPVAGALEYAGGKLYITNVAHQRALDRTSDVAVATVTVNNEAAETILWTGSMAANSLKAGNIFKFHADGLVSNDGNHANNNFTLRVRIGGITGTIAATLTPTTKAMTNEHWHLDANACQRTLGGSGSRAVHLDLVVGDDDTEVIGIATVDTGANMDVVLTVDWVTAHTNNSISLYQGFMEYKN